MKGVCLHVERGAGEVFTRKQGTIFNFDPTEKDRTLPSFLFKLCECSNVCRFHPTLLLLLLDVKKGFAILGQRKIGNFLTSSGGWKRRQIYRSGGKGKLVLGPLGRQMQACSANSPERFALTWTLFLIPGETDLLKHLSQRAWRAPKEKSLRTLRR